MVPPDFVVDPPEQLLVAVKLATSPQRSSTVDPRLLGVDPLHNEVLRDDSVFLSVEEGVDFELSPDEVYALFAFAASLRPPKASLEDATDEIGVVALPYVEFIGVGELLGGVDVETVAVVDFPEEIAVEFDFV